MARRAAADLRSRRYLPMSHRNASDAVLEFRKAAREFSQTYLPLVTRIRDKYSANPSGQPQADIAAALEAHGRNYLIDSLLSALNWNITSASGAFLAGLVSEAPIVSTLDEETRFIDYLGLDRQTEKPVLIVEAKRPGSPLPMRKQPVPATGSKKSGGVEETIQQILLAGLAGTELLYDWDKWLKTVRDYVTTVHRRAGVAPRRVVLTDGCWCIVFLEPELLFEKATGANVDHIRVFQADSVAASFGGEIDTRFGELFGYLEYHRLAGSSPPLLPKDLPFHFSAQQPLDAMRGLRLKYVEHAGIYEISPSIEVSPVIFVRSAGSPWFEVASNEVQFLPPKEEDVVEHLNEVATVATRLETEIAAAHPSAMGWSTLQQHYADDRGFSQIPGVSAFPDDQFLVVTGQATHYLRPVPSVIACPFHDWEGARATGMQWPTQAPISFPSVDPRVWFPNSGVHHCAHRDVESIKREAVTAANRAQCGPRGAKDNQAFCEIRMFERHLCCRTCVFEDVCEKAVVFQPPCKKAVAQSAATTS